jgi:hypothetical protein
LEAFEHFYRKINTGLGLTPLRLYGSNRLWKAVQEAGVLLALFDGKTDIDPEGEEIGRLTDPPR